MYTIEEYGQIADDIYRKIDQIDKEGQSDKTLEAIAMQMYIKSEGMTTNDVAVKIRENLACVNWEEILQNIHTKQSQIHDLRVYLHEAFQDTITQCDYCKEKFTYRNLNKVEPPYYGNYCQKCVEILKKAMYRDCLLCGTTYKTKRINEALDVCYCCRTDQVIAEWRKVQSHTSRARSNNQEATLNIKQWLFTLETFAYSCAYCQGTYKHLEHYIPLPHGGTTRANCLPSCERCNHIKKDKSPEQFEHLFPSANIQRIKEYQAAI